MKARSPIRSSFFLLLGLFPLLVGCKSTELLELALRSREQDIQVLREEVVRLEYENEALHRELHAVRKQGVFKVTPELASQTYTLKHITLGRTTGGIDEDRKEGDEALQVVIEPRDVANHLIKAPGQVEITALEVTPEGLKAPLSVWKISPEQLATSWKQGLFSTGYVLILPWQQTPSFENVRVVVRFELIDGRPFEADTDIKIRLNPALTRPRPVLPHEEKPGPFPEPEEILPHPQPLPDVPEEAPLPDSGPILRPAGHWQLPSLEGAIKLRTPITIQPVPVSFY